MDGWMNGWMDRWMDEHTDKQTTDKKKYIIEKMKITFFGLKHQIYTCKPLVNIQQPHLSMHTKICTKFTSRTQYTI